MNIAWSWHWMCVLGRWHDVSFYIFWLSKRERLRKKKLLRKQYRAGYGTPPSRNPNDFRSPYPLSAIWRPISFTGSVLRRVLWNSFLSGRMHCTSHSGCRTTAACVSKPLRVIDLVHQQKIILVTLPGKEEMGFWEVTSAAVFRVS